MRYEKVLTPSRYKTHKPRVSKRLKYCTDCKCVWELDFNRNSPIIRYEDFPTIGLVREQCKICKSE